MARTEINLANFDDGKAGATLVYDDVTLKVLAVKTWGGAVIKQFPTLSGTWGKAEEKDMSKENLFGGTKGTDVLNGFSYEVSSA